MQLVGRLLRALHELIRHVLEAFRAVDALEIACIAREVVVHLKLADFGAETFELRVDQLIVVVVEYILRQVRKDVELDLVLS